MKTDRELLEQALKLVAKYHARKTILVDWEKSVIEAISARLAGLDEDDEKPFLWVETDKNGELNWDVTCMFSDSPAFIERPLPLYRRPQPKARLAEDEDDPVAWLTENGSIFRSHEIAAIGQENGPYPLYRHPPPARKLTDEEIDDVISKQRFFYGADANAYTFARAIEQKIWEKNS